jgi:hypothetical protein
MIDALTRKDYLHFLAHHSAVYSWTAKLLTSALALSNLS